MSGRRNADAPCLCQFDKPVRLIAIRRAGIGAALYLAATIDPTPDRRRRSYARRPPLTVAARANATVSGERSGSKDANMPLSNPRHERFAQALFEGKPASTAFEEAGYVPNDGNAIRLKGNERVQARLRELQEAVAKKTEVTVESLLAELEHARQRADGLDQLSAAVKAISEKARFPAC